LKRIVAVTSFALASFVSTVAVADEDAPAPASALPSRAPATSEPAAPPVEPSPSTLRPPLRRRFGAAGSVVLDDLVGFGMRSSTGNVGIAPGIGLVGGSAVGSAVTGWVSFNRTTLGDDELSTVALAPTVDVFVAPRLSLGSQLTLFSAKSTSTSSAFGDTSFVGGGLRPRIGWVIPLGDDLSFWPRGFASFTAMHSTVESGISPDHARSTSTVISWSVGGEGVLVAQVARFVALTFGPTISYGNMQTLDTQATGSSSTTLSVGVRGGISLVL
jgi:hypothetical protein